MSIKFQRNYLNNYKRIADERFKRIADRFLKEMFEGIWNYKGIEVQKIVNPEKMQNDLAKTFPEKLSKKFPESLSNE